MEYKGFCGQAYRAASKIAGSDTCVNLWLEFSDTRKKIVLFGRPGLLEYSGTFSGGGPVGGLWAGDNRLFAVINSKLYEVFELGGPAPNLIGDVGLSTGQATMVNNGSELMCVNAGKVYIATGTTLVQPTDADGPVLGATGTFLDGYFIVNVPNSKTWRWSNVNNGLTWDPLDTEQKEGYSDNISRVIAHDRRLWLFGFQTTEIWQNSGTPPPGSPFSRVAFIPQGCPAPYSVAPVGPTSLMWLGGSDDQGMGCIMRADSVQPIRVSTHALEYEISTYGGVTNAEAYGTLIRGHYLYVLTFPSPGITWVYDLTTSARLGEPVWTRYAGFENGNYTRYRGRCHAFVQGWNSGAGRHILGDYLNGQLFEERPTYLTDGPRIIKRERTAPLLVEEDKRITVWRIELLMQNGTIASGDATMMLEISRDAGATWSNVKEASAGSLGEYGQRVIWRQCGTGRRLVFRITDTNEMEVCYTDAFLRADVSDA